jgi:hypothetical protein
MTLKGCGRNTRLGVLKEKIQSHIWANQGEEIDDRMLNDDHGLRWVSIWLQSLMPKRAGDAKQEGWGCYIPEGQLWEQVDHC